MIVVDASVIVPALADDDRDGDLARARLQGQRLVAPEIIDLEAVSALRRLLGTGALDARRAAFAVRDLDALDLRRVAHRPLLGRIWSHRHNLTPYDAAYVALAEMVEALLVTADERLAAAPGVTCPVELIER